MSHPPIQYARSGDAELAFEVMGDGPVDLLLLSYSFPIHTHLEEPALARYLERLATFSRVIRFDRRGVGASDPISLDNPPTLEQGAADALAVLDATRSERAAILTDQGTTHIGVLLAASHPTRVSKLILVHPYARGLRADDFPLGLPGEQLEAEIQRQKERVRMGTGHEAYDREIDDPEVKAWARRSSQRLSPATSATLLKVSMESDVRAVLPTLRVPTLVVARKGARSGARANAIDVVERVPDAQLVEVDGSSVISWYGPFEPLLEVVQEFLVGTRPALIDDRVFATLLFTDIVSSTERVAAAGDKDWRQQLDRHDEIVRSELARHRGRVVNPTGDGALATFDGPARAIRCAQSIVSRAAEIDLPLRAGLHAGEVELRGEDVAGIAVHIAQRVSTLADAGEILVSRTLTDLVAGSGLEFDDRGEHELKGVPGRWQLSAVRS